MTIYLNIEAISNGLSIMMSYDEINDCWNLSNGKYSIVLKQKELYEMFNLYASKVLMEHNYV